MTLLPPISEDWEHVRRHVAEIECELNASRTPPIPAILQEMLVSAEDRRFFHHAGYDARAILRAAYQTATGHPQGGSTIAQQLARIVTGRFERSLCRKFREIRLAIRITQEFPRTHIPAIYLAVAYYGWRMNGLEQAYRRLSLFGRTLTSEEAAGIVARLKYPEPRQTPEKRRRMIMLRTKHVLRLHSKQWSKVADSPFKNFN
jgi:membrane carboxypeptidase/penicillin-binding protein